MPPSRFHLSISANVHNTSKPGRIRPRDSREGRGEREDSPALLQRQARVSRLGAAEMRAVAGRIESGGTEIVVAPFNALPDRIKQKAAKLGIPAEAIRAVRDQGTMYLVENRSESEADAEEAVFHEHYHKWMGRHLGRSMQNDLSVTFNSIGKPEAVLSLADYANHVKREVRFGPLLVMTCQGEGRGDYVKIDTSREVASYIGLSQSSPSSSLRGLS